MTSSNTLKVFGEKKQMMRAMRSIQYPCARVRFSEGDAIEAFGKVWKELVVRIKGDAWKLTDKVVEELRAKKYPKLLK
jgi:hypothetical protein